jgi:hypothetical protein
MGMKYLWKDEIVDLRDAFNTMAIHIHDHYSLLEQVFPRLMVNLRKINFILFFIIESTSEDTGITRGTSSSRGCKCCKRAIFGQHEP